MQFLMEEAEYILRELKSTGKILNELWLALHATKSLQEKGIPEWCWGRLHEISEKIEDPNFVTTAIRLKEIEDKIGLNYESIVNRYEKLSQEIPKLEQKAKEGRKELKSIDGERKKESTKLEKLESDFDKELAEQNLIREDVKLVNELRGKIFPGSADLKRDIKNLFETAKSTVRKKEEGEQELCKMRDEKLELQKEIGELSEQRNKLALEFDKIAQEVFDQVYREFERRVKLGKVLSIGQIRELFQGTAELAARRLKDLTYAGG